MGTLVKSEKSENKQFQFSVWKNGDLFMVEIKKFRRAADGKLNFYDVQSIKMSVQEFEYFKQWIKTIKKKK